MKKIRYIFLSMMVALSLASCQKEPTEHTITETEVPEGFVKIEVGHSADFGNIELLTRSGDNALIATAREMAIKNAYLCVFADDGNGDASDDKLIQFKPVIRDVVGSTTMYYAVLEEVLSPVILHGVSNIDQSTIDIISATEVGGGYKISRQDFYDNANIAYPGETNQALRNDDNGLLPKYVERINLSQLTRETVADVEAVTKFSYARVDVVMPEPYADYPQVLGMSVSNAPTLPYSPSRTQTFVQSHEVTPETNEHSYSGEFWPDGVTTENQATKYVQGMYIYSTAVGTDVLTDMTKATYLIIRARKDASTSAGGTYYKIALRLKDGVTGQYDYSIKASNRYLVRVHALDSDGYASAQEAIAGPPSNINYDITIDGTSTSITSNGQYYIGSEKIELSAEGKSQSNMVYANPQIIEFAHQSDESWTINNDGSLGVDLVFSYNAGEGSSIAVGDLTKEILLPDGVEYDDAAGYSDNSTNWNNSFGTKKLRLKVTNGYVDDDIEIKVGELTHRVKFAAKGELYTDYTDIDFVKELTNLDYTYGGVPIGQVRVANSYILAPMQTAPTIYYIPVAERINEFWRDADYAVANQTDTYAELLTTDWTNNANYSVEVSWYDGANVDGLEVAKAFSPAGKNAIKVILPPRFEHQNIAVNVKYGTTIIWSWHLWVTDYNPYFVTLKENSSSAAAYPVRTQTDQIEDMAGSDNSDKELHSYSGAIWQTGNYKDKFIMDRNLGAFGNDFAGHGSVIDDNVKNKGVLYYQFGRKDPFPGDAAKYINGNNFVTSIRSSISMAAAVQAPTTLNADNIPTGNSYRWSNNPISDRTDIQWFDKNLFLNAETGKSLFDPSPLGYRVPMDGVWDGFLATGSVSGNNGRTYRNFAYYPYVGYRSVFDGTIGVAGTATIIRTTSPSRSNTHYTNIGIRLDNNAAIEGHYSHGGGFNIRPVQE